MSLVVHINTIVFIILICLLFYDITEHINILQTLQLKHPQILIVFMIIFNIIKNVDYIIGQLLFHYVPHDFQEMALRLIIIPKFTQQLVDTFLINILWSITKINYIILNEQIIHTMEKIINVNYSLVFIYAFYICILNR
jgi:hypothetical protein